MPVARTKFSREDFDSFLWRSFQDVWKVVDIHYVDRLMVQKFSAEFLRTSLTNKKLIAGAVKELVADFNEQSLEYP